MCKLASCCLLFIALLKPVSALPILGSGEASFQPSARSRDTREPLGALERTPVVLQPGPEMLGAGRSARLREADPQTDIFNPRGNLKQAFSGQGPNILLSHLLARTRKQYKKRGTPSECFWKYCV
ncbi:urotensin-2 isoform X2 [Oryctolagus cuniculus]|uniref:urotensin-2 isoform X2 n=1 Tax=Oryctolagus cuniculus TaxID=9986 RepID=UPI00387A6A0D